jgi:hypothetical protein
MPRRHEVQRPKAKGAETMKHTTTSPTPIRSEELKRQTVKEAIAANISRLIDQLFFWQGMRSPCEPGEMRSRQSLRHGFSTIRVDGCGPKRPGLAVSRPIPKSSLLPSRTSLRSTRECGADALGLEENSLVFGM